MSGSSDKCRPAFVRNALPAIPISATMRGDIWRWRLTADGLTGPDPKYAPWILKDAIFALFDRLEITDDTPYMGFDVFGRRLKVHGVARHHLENLLSRSSPSDDRGKRPLA
jgi:hypothetical protein